MVFSGDLDRAIAAFIIATGAASWAARSPSSYLLGLNILRRAEGTAVRKPFMERMFGAMMPRGSKNWVVRMNMLGMGPRLIRRVMAEKCRLPGALMEQALSRSAPGCLPDVHGGNGYYPEELIDGVEVGGVASYLDAAEEANVNLFI